MNTSQQQLWVTNYSQDDRKHSKERNYGDSGNGYIKMIAVAISNLRNENSKRVSKLRKSQNVENTRLLSQSIKK